MCLPGIWLVDSFARSSRLMILSGYNYWIPVPCSNVTNVDSKSTLV